MARGGVTVEDFNAKGSKPGSLKAISQHKAIAEGYEAAPTKCKINRSQPKTMTGRCVAPGMMSKARKGMA